MTKQWQAWSDRWDSLSLREKVLLLLTAVVVPLLLIYVLLIEKQWAAAQRLPTQIKNLEQEVQHQERLLGVLNAKQAVDPDIAAREELQAFRDELSTQDQNICRAAANLVSPEQMLSMLRSVLAFESEAQLLTAKSLPVETITLGGDNTAAEESAPPQSMIFMHPFEIELQGSFQGVYDYLLRLENLDGVFFWDLLDYSVEEYPTAKVKLKVHTLSSEAGWLGA